MYHTHPKVIPWERTNKLTDKWRDGHTDGWTNGQIFTQYLEISHSIPEGSLDTKRSPFLCFNAGGRLRQCSLRSTSCRATIFSNKVEPSPQDVADLESRACSQFLCPLILTKPLKSLSGLWQDCLFDCQKNTACEKVLFVTIGWTNRQQTTTPDQDWLVYCC